MNKIKKYTIILEENDGKLRLNRRNDGFSSFELLGILSHAKLEILKQMNEEIKPDIVTRSFIED